MNEDEDEEEDRISLLPDCLIIEIISLLPTTKEAIKTSALSKRWQYLWTHVPYLIFLKRHDDNHSISDFFSFVDQTLTQCRQSNLIKFSVQTTYDIQFESQVNSWIRYAVNRNVQDLCLALWTRFEFELRYGLFFTNSSFTNLFVSRCNFIPSCAISWNKLTTLHIAHANLNEDLIENILSGSPLLEDLVLYNCDGFKRIDITSKSVKNFLFYGYVSSRDDIIEINAPYIVSLAIEYDMFLGMLSLLNVSSLLKAYLNYGPYEYDEAPCNEAEVEMFKGLILSLRHVKELEIGFLCSKVFSCLEAKGFVFPSNLKVADWYEYDHDSDEAGDSEELWFDDGHESEGDEAN
nr:hypothetical protein [Tanacetum cinerariifolium]